MGGISVLSSVGKYEGYGFRLGAVSGVIAAGLAAGADVFSFRNITSTRKIRLLEVRVSAAADATAFTAGSASLQLFAARGMSASDTGGTAITLTGNNQKLRTTQVASQLQGAGGDVRIAATAALGAGTRTLDGAPSGAVVFGVPATAGVQLVNDTDIYFVGIGSYALPLVLDQNEGFVIQANVPATGTWRFAVTVAWAEIDGGGGLRS